jgi:hypothetical protein
MSVKRDKRCFPHIDFVSNSQNRSATPRLSSQTPRSARKECARGFAGGFAVVLPRRPLTLLGRKHSFIQGDYVGGGPLCGARRKLRSSAAVHSLIVVPCWS